MSSTEVVVSPAARREIKKLTKDRQKQTIALLRTLENGSETLMIEKIKGHPSFFRIRRGDMRVVYHYITRNRVVVLVVRDRKDAYRGLDDLDRKLLAALQALGEEQAGNVRKAGTI
ncbi:MAG: type II toxin-antitoxin system RelE/ParE family toxin [Hoeflea sp.]|uniref:type II toxin-antitoxin system RelE family toxin n=1 Tax=Hoeflea sp. TaxID=1940281 RepID=UPI001D4AC11C|nr:type II toxin-antitoxin system RelE/ParE family toxin [Hoeflea sp.]MBU4531225.1 type II toxin-antitoxin system RelE/ParE family toxin [Alphaproteobacteria bacterium]MBU4545712.1 type II toxin-antitoxin system RelE/ParE family toxin [Alphaproteobacteria bacterium]MBU4550681.1 type II toxin-antitoxin system RelE/ParE family toxin [Alphaproteobacteria bacterium]MBV1724502.1 type II toxin-antitoxin system RelE/ParE family toxin [Hoeflea sp.]MBV1760522.1 type II toxin-antitoxin system RelE/ParE 